MKLSTSLRALSIFILIGQAIGATYSQMSNVVGTDFNSFFSYQAIANPTNGHVNYVSEATAQADNLTYASGDMFILRADNTTVLSSTGPGRNSVRLMSNTQYTTHIAVFNMRHMPQGCATWPAVWETGTNWPADGEVDIVEGVNLQTNDQTTLHTNPGCTIPASGTTETGTVLSTDCDATANGNSGCGIKAASASSYGVGFNAAGGRLYAIEQTTDFIKVWFWSATGRNPPSDAASGAATVDTDNWGTPDTYFLNTNCDIATMFAANNIIINLTFCGDWAGNVYTTSGCPSTCNDYCTISTVGLTLFGVTSLSVTLSFEGSKAPVTSDKPKK